jgi:phosphoribosyl 1,2-cyclic phosphodiesterase
VEVRCGDQVLILDAGSGLRPLGEKLSREDTEQVSFLISHVHWDHILGFPYFEPALNPDAEILLFGERKGGQGCDEILLNQARLSPDPVPSEEEAGATIQYEAIKPADEWSVGDVTIRADRVQHPDGCVAFRIDYQGHSVVYATDTEHLEGRLDQRLVRLCEGADALIYDAMYTEEEYRGEVGGSKKGWGHSTWNAGVAVAEAAGVNRFFLFHHEPLHSDRFVEAIEKEAAKVFPRAVAAREGMRLNLKTGRVSRPKVDVVRRRRPAPAIAVR